MLVAQPAPPALRDEHPLALGREVRKDFVRVFVADDGADRQLDEDVFARETRAVRAHSVLAAARAPFALELEMVERVQTPGPDDVDRPAASAVAAGGSAFRDVLLTPEGDASIAAVAGFDADRRLIDEHTTPNLLPRECRKHRGKIDACLTRRA